MRLKLDNGKTYSIAAMFSPKRVGRSAAWGAFRGNLRAWPKALLIPIESKVTFVGLVSWLVVFLCHTVSLFLLLFMSAFGYSTYAYAFFTKDDASKMADYRKALQQVYDDLKHIEDQEEYKARLKEEIAKIKPF